MLPGRQMGGFMYITIDDGRIISIVHIGPIGRMPVGNGERIEIQNGLYFGYVMVHKGFIINSN